MARRDRHASWLGTWLWPSLVVSCVAAVGVAQAGESVGRTVYVSDCQPGAEPTCVPGDDANTGDSETAPRRTLEGLDLNAMPAGSRLLFARGGVWVRQAMILLDNPHATRELPLVIDAYGAGPRPWIKVPGQKAVAIAFGKYNNTSNDGGYVLRNLKIDGMRQAMWGLFFVHNLHDVTVENNEITGFQIGIHSQARMPHGVTRVAIRNNDISRNLAMGILGQFSHSSIEGNRLEANNASGSAYNHAIYLSGNEASGRDNVVRNNILRRNSVVAGMCRGGNITMHGQMDGMLIEGNTIEQAASTRSCRGVSITSGYATPEWFRNFVVRRNTVINLGRCGVCVNSAPGIVIEGNKFYNDQREPHTAVLIRGTGDRGDDSGHGAIVRDNLACFLLGPPHQTIAEGALGEVTFSANDMHAGAAASTGVCVR